MSTFDGDCDWKLSFILLVSSNENTLKILFLKLLPHHHAPKTDHRTHVNRLMYFIQI